MNLKDKKVLVTGGSKGIGREIIRQLVEQDVTDIAVVGRKKEDLEKLEQEFSSVNFLIIPGDVSKTDDIEKISKKIKEAWGSLDILVNNAGVVSAGPLTEISDEDIINQININLTGLILLTKKVLPLLKETNEGAIINISSGLGYIAMPFYSVYAATKAAVRQFSDAIRREYPDYPLHVMTVYPTATDTDMMKNAKAGNMDSAEKVAKKTIEGLLSKKINVILGGEEREKQIEINFNEPEKMDKMTKDNYENMKKRTENHRSM